MEERRALSSPRLLVVEHDARVAEDLALRLKELDYQLAGVAGDAPRAIELVESLKPDLVLMDIVLPGGGNSIDTAREITRRYAVPVVFITARADEPRAKRAAHDEPFSYVVKPVNSCDLQAAVSVALYRSRLERDVENVRWGADVCNRLSDAIIALDRDRRIVFVNDAAEQLLRREGPTLLGQAWDDSILPCQDDQPLPVGNRLADVLANGKSRVFDEVLRINEHDRTRIMKVQMIPIDQDHGPCSGVAVALQDISREGAYAILQKERNFSRAVLDTIGSVVVVLDRAGEIIYFNKAAQQLTGYTEQEVRGRCVWDILLVPEETAGVKDVFARLTSGDFPNRYENHWVTRTGERRSIAWSNSALLDSRGEVEYVIATGIDITDQRRAEQDLAHVEMQWNEVIDVFADAIYLVGLDDKVVRANRAFYAITGTTPGDVIGRDIKEIMHPRGERMPCPVCAARDNRRDTTIVFESDHPDNPIGRPLEVTLRVIRDGQGEALGFLMGLRDLSEQRKVEAELRQHRDHLEHLVRQRTSALESANSELETFSYSVSHDLRAPLRGIDGFSHALLEEYGDKLDEVGQDYLRRVRKASQRMGLLIDDLLELSRVGRNVMENKWVDLSRIASEILGELQEAEPEQHLAAHVQDGLRGCGDPTLLRLLLQNLLENAWKFSAVRETREITFEMIEYEKGKSAFLVRDNGVGFDMTYAGKLFGAFQRLHGGAEFEGTGIGLATVQRIVHRHEGEVWAESRVNQGATFYFTLPDGRCL